MHLAHGANAQKLVAAEPKPVLELARSKENAKEKKQKNKIATNKNAAASPKEKNSNTDSLRRIAINDANAMMAHMNASLTKKASFYLDVKVKRLIFSVALK